MLKLKYNNNGLKILVQPIYMLSILSLVVWIGVCAYTFFLGNQNQFYCSNLQSKPKTNRTLLVWINQVSVCWTLQIFTSFLIKFAVFLFYKLKTKWIYLAFKCMDAKTNWHSDSTLYVRWICSIQIGLLVLRLFVHPSYNTNMGVQSVSQEKLYYIKHFSPFTLLVLVFF